jgi:WD40 repeat protein
MQIHSIQKIHHLQGHRGAVYTLCNGIDEGSMLSSGSDGMICKWIPDTSHTGVTIAQTGERVFSLYSFPDKKIIFAGTMQGDLFYLKFQNEKVAKRFTFHAGSVYRLNKWNGQLVAAGGDGILSTWNVDHGDILHHLKISHQKLRSLDIDATGNTLYTGDANGNLWILQLPELTLIEKIERLHNKTIFSLKFLASENHLTSGGLDAHLKISDKKGSLLQDLQAHWFCINDICELTHTSYIATASRDKSIRIWDKRDWSLVKEISSPKFAAHLHSVNSLLWNEQKTILYSAGDDGNIFGWKLEIGN